MDRLQRHENAKAWLRRRHESGESARSLARLCGVDVATVLGIVGGGTVAQLRTIERVERAMTTKGRVT